MAEFVLLKPYVLLDSVDLSGYVRSVTVRGSYAEVENTAGTDGVTRLKGLSDWSMDFTFNQDFTASKVDATIYGVWSGTGGAPVEVRASTDSVGATNPSWEGTGEIFEYTPITGSTGANAETPVTMKGVDGNVLARETS